MAVTKYVPVELVEEEKAKELAAEADAREAAQSYAGIDPDAYRDLNRRAGIHHSRAALLDTIISKAVPMESKSDQSKVAPVGRDRHTHVYPGPILCPRCEAREREIDGLYERLSASMESVNEKLKEALERIYAAPVIAGWSGLRAIAREALSSQSPREEE